MRIEVKKEHIERGRSGIFGCPVALALNYATGGKNWRANTEACYNENMIEHPYPEGVGRWIRRFDNGETVAPFAFNI